MTDDTTPRTLDEFRERGWRELSKTEIEALLKRTPAFVQPPDCSLASNDGKQWSVDVYVCMCVDREVKCWVRPR